MCLFLIAREVKCEKVELIMSEMAGLGVWKGEW